MSVVDGLYRRWFGCFVVTGRCCVLHVVFLWDDYCLVDVLSSAAPRAFLRGGHARGATTRSSDWIVHGRSRVKLVEIFSDLKVRSWEDISVRPQVLITGIRYDFKTPVARGNATAMQLT